MFRKEIHINSSSISRSVTAFLSGINQTGRNSQQSAVGAVASQSNRVEVYPRIRVRKIVNRTIVRGLSQKATKDIELE